MCKAEQNGLEISMNKMYHSSSSNRLYKIKHSWHLKTHNSKISWILQMKEVEMIVWQVINQKDDHQFI